MSGRVVDATTGKPVAEAVVFVRDWRALCDADGRFTIMLPVGRFTLEAAASRYQTVTTPVDACAGCRPLLELALVPTHLVSEHVSVSASVNGGGDLVATTPVRPLEVLNVAGAFENVFRVLQTLPGVTGTGEASSRISVRGGGPDQNMTVMDGVEIHNPYRLYGLTSAFNPEIVESFELSTGAFSAQYGDRLSSILTIETRPGKSASLVAGSVGLSLTDGNAVLEGRIPGKLGSWLLTARRTWYDLVAERFASGDNDLPSFTDVQGKLAFDLGAGRSLTLSGLRSREDSAMEFTEDFDEGVLDTRTRNDLASAALFLPLGVRGTSRTIAAYYDDTDDLTIDGSFRDDARRSNTADDGLAFSSTDLTGRVGRKVRDLSFRQELTWNPFGSHVIGAGLELHSLETREELRFDLGDRAEEGRRLARLAWDVERKHERYGAWLYDRFPLGRRIEVDAGLRFDESRINARAELLPRVAVTARVLAGTRLRAAYGMHSQSPGYEKLFQADYSVDLSADGRLDLDNEHARHLVMGFEHDFARGLSARVEGFYKRFDDMIVGRLETEAERRERIDHYDFPDQLAASVPRQALITSEPTNDGKGGAYGFDVFLARRAVSSDSRLSGWLAYTYTKATTEAYGRRYPFDYEQPHALSLVASYRLHQRVELSLTARFASGFPHTSPRGLYVTGAWDVADADGDGVTAEIVPDRDQDGAYVYAIDYGGIDAVNRGRLPWYGRVDFRATFVPSFGKGRLRFYVDVINLLNRNNGLVREELAYDPEAEEPRVAIERLEGFPFMPSFGVHLRF